MSWEQQLAITRQLLLTRLGLRVVSALGETEGLDSCGALADLMILGHSVPLEEKRKLIDCFRQRNEAPVLSLLRPGYEKLPEANYGVESARPEDFLEMVQKILN